MIVMIINLTQNYFSFFCCKKRFYEKLYTVKCCYNAVQFSLFDTLHCIDSSRTQIRIETYLTLTGELWDVCCEEIRENWLVLKIKGQNVR